MKTDYAAHELRYRRLRESGAGGWGAANFARRMSDWETTLSSFLERSRPSSSARFLELGCGAGDVALRIAQRGFSVAGLEISRTAVDWAREKFRAEGREADLRVGDVCTLPWPSVSFDVVIDGNCLHCIVGDDRAKVFGEIHRVLRVGGHLLVSSMVGDPKREVADFDSRTRCQMNGKVAVRYMPLPESLLAEISGAGFRVETSRISSNSWWDHLTVEAVRI